MPLGHRVKRKEITALTREVRPVAELVRFVVGPTGEAVPDVKRKLSGRGIWVTGTRSAIEDAAERNVFARGFKREVRIPEDLAAQTERLLERAALDALAIAGKGGAIVKEIGTRARPEIEALLGHPVFLELKVKVRPRWRRDAATLERLGL